MLPSRAQPRDSARAAALPDSRRIPVVVLRILVDWLACRSRGSLMMRPAQAEAGVQAGQLRSHVPPKPGAAIPEARIHRKVRWQAAQSRERLDRTAARQCHRRPQVLRANAMRPALAPMGRIRSERPMSRRAAALDSLALALVPALPSAQPADRRRCRGANQAVRPHSPVRRPECPAEVVHTPVVAVRTAVAVRTSVGHAARSRWVDWACHRD